MPHGLVGLGLDEVLLGGELEDLVVLLVFGGGVGPNIGAIVTASLVDPGFDVVCGVGSGLRDLGRMGSYVLPSAATES